MKLLISLLMITAGMSSCAHVYYAPNTPNAPLLSEKGETRINAMYCSGGYADYTGGELQFAHAVSKNCGIMANGFFVGQTEEVSDWNLQYPSTHTEKGNGSYVELGGGYFAHVARNKKWIAEVYSGFGLGSVKSDYGFGDNSKVSVSKFFIQPSIGFKSLYFEAIIVPKFSYISWKIKESSVSEPSNEDKKLDIETMRDKPGFASFEPALILRAGGENFKIQGGLSVSSNGRRSANSPQLTESLNASIGISINLKPSKK